MMAILQTMKVKVLAMTSHESNRFLLKSAGWPVSCRGPHLNIN